MSLRPAALLLEVVIALAVLVGAMGLLGAQLAGGLEMTRYAEAELRGTLLADRVLALVMGDPNTQQKLTEYEELEEEFGDDQPGYFYYVKAEQVDRDTQDIKVVTIRVLYQPDPERPDSIDGALVVRQLGFLKADPPKIDLIEQAGLTEDLAEQLRQLVPIAGFDPRSVDLQQLMSLLDEGTLEQLMPMLMPLLQQLAAGGIPPEWAGLAEGLLGGSAGLPGGASTGDLAEAIRQAVGNPQQQPPPGPPRTPPRAAPPPPPAVSEPRGGTPAPPKTPAPPAQPPPRPAPGRGSGPNGEYTIEDLMRMRDEYERSQGNLR